MGGCQGDAKVFFFFLVFLVCCFGIAIGQSQKSPPLGLLTDFYNSLDSAG